MLLIGIGWGFVVLLAALVEATSAPGAWLGAIATLLFWGVIPIGLLGYLALAPARRRRRRALEATEASTPSGPPVPLDPDQSGHASGDTVPPVRKET